MPRNALFAQRTVGGIFALLDESKSTGNFWFVNATGGVDAVGNGTSPDAPFKTINFASTQLTNDFQDYPPISDRHDEWPIYLREQVPLAGLDLCVFGYANSLTFLKWQELELTATSQPDTQGGELNWLISTT